MALREVIDPAFAWGDAHWRGLPLHDYILYELHVGTFTLRRNLRRRSFRTWTSWRHWA